MPHSLAGKIALVTAAGQGIGLATARSFAAAGATVWATDINEKALQQLAAEHPEIKTCTLDVTKTVDVNEVVQKIGRIDVLFNCAGYVHQGNILDCSEEAWAFTLDLNISSMYRTCKAVLPVMIAAGGGTIVNMSSVASSIKGAPNRFAYGASKAAVIGLTKSIAADFVTKGIRCNAICPGTVETPSLHERVSAQGDYDTVRAAFVARQPMGRLGTAEEIANAALYLASGESSFMTGQLLVIDGGWSV
jgi:2-keto-3-deoxy-L-fuconate dehydrogenase